PRYDRTVGPADPRAGEHPRHTQRANPEGARRARRAPADVRFSPNAGDPGPGAADGEGMEGERHVRDARGVRAAVRRFAEAVRLVQLDVEMVRSTDVPPGFEPHQPEVKLDAAVLDDAASRRAQIDGI